MKLPRCRAGHFTRQELAACVRRELAFRKRYYPRLIEVGRMESDIAIRETQMMQAILELLEHQPELRP